MTTSTSKPRAAGYWINQRLTRSPKALDTESRGLLVLTAATKALAAAAGITRAEARRRLLAAGAAETHHVGVYPRVCGYYDWRDCAEETTNGTR